MKLELNLRNFEINIIQNLINVKQKDSFKKKILN